MTAFIKSFTAVGNETKTTEALNYPDFKLLSNYEVVVGGIEKKNYQNFKGVLYDWNLSTIYLSTLTEFSYLLSGSAESFKYAGNWINSNFEIQNNKIISYGMIPSSFINNPTLQSKIEQGIDSSNQSTNMKSAQNNKSSRLLQNNSMNKISYTNSEEQIKKNIYGLRYYFKDYTKINQLNLETANNPETEILTLNAEKGSDQNPFKIGRFLLYINFSFEEIIGEELILFSSSNPKSKNGFYISLVEKQKEDFSKSFSSDGVNVLPTNIIPASNYSYDSSLNKPKVIKLQIISENDKTFTFISPINIPPNKQHRLTIGFFVYSPHIIRAFYQYEKKFLFTHEEADLPFNFSDEDVSLYSFNGVVLFA